jgi:two-component system chemotaxis sensor kinase CheA
MELDSYIDLYLAETQENLRLLNQALLGLESGGAIGELDEAFRAAHTIKGTAAMMGFPQVAEIAHALEDLLEELRTGDRVVDSTLIDELFAAVDLLERTNEVVVTGAAPEQERVTLVVRVEFEAACVLKAARAAVVQRNLTRLAEVIGTVPASLDDDFDGSFQLFLVSGADRGELENAVRTAGEVADVEIAEALGVDVAAALEAAASGAREDGGAGAKADQGGAGSGTRRFLRIDAEHLGRLGDGVADLGILCGRLESIAARLADPTLVGLVEGVRRRVSDLEHTTLEARLVPVGEVFHRFPRLVRDTATALGKRVEFRLEGQEIEADRQVLEEVADPLVHLLRNAVDHGIGTPEEREAVGKPPRGVLVLRAVRERASIRIDIEDDGRGVPRERVVEKAQALGIFSGKGPVGDEELLRLLSHPGFTTAGEVTGVSGRGVGLDAVVNRIRSLGGAVMLKTEASRGTTFGLRLPSNLTMTQSLRVLVGGEDYAIPLTHVAEVVELEALAVKKTRGRERLTLRGEELPLIRMGRVLQVAEQGAERAAVVVEVGDRRHALAVDELVGREQIVVKSFIVAAGTLPIFSGATLLADGRPALVLDPVSVL